MTERFARPCRNPQLTPRGTAVPTVKPLSKESRPSIEMEISCERVVACEPEAG
jgi:hypothetical protein